MNLGTLIRALSSYPADSELRIEGPAPLTPHEMNSYRGYYEDLAIGFREYRWDDPHRMTCGRFAKILIDAVGQPFTGYNGGEYIMTEETLVWVSNYRDASGCRVDCVYEDGNVVYPGRADAVGEAVKSLASCLPLWRRYLWTKELGANRPRPAHNDNDGEPRNDRGARLTGTDRIRAKRRMAREGRA